MTNVNQGKPNEPLINNLKLSVKEKSDIKKGKSNSLNSKLLNTIY